MRKSISALLLVNVLTTGVLPLYAQEDCDSAAGEKQFNKCVACHSMEAGTHMMGPSLHDLMGRKVGTAQGFTFSPAMEQADFAWTDSTLSAFLENPMQYVPGTAMPFGGIKKAEQRAELVCYIKQQQ
jgi:cytochrome c